MHRGWTCADARWQDGNTRVGMRISRRRWAAADGMGWVDGWMGRWIPITPRRLGRAARQPRGARERCQPRNYADLCQMRIPHTHRHAAPNPHRTPPQSNTSPSLFLFFIFYFYFYFSTVDADVPVRLFVVCRYLACTYGCTCICMRTHTHTGHRYTRTHKEIGNGFATLFVRASRSPELCDRVSVLAGYKACTRRGALCYGQHPSFFFVLG